MAIQTVTGDGGVWGFVCDCEGAFASARWPSEAVAQLRADRHEHEHATGALMPPEPVTARGAFDTATVDAPASWDVADPPEPSGFATARRLDGSSHLLAADDTSLRTPATALTIAGWVKFPTADYGDTYGAIVFKTYGASTPWLSYAIQNTGTVGTFRFRISNGTTIYQTDESAVMPVGEWLYLAATWTSGADMVLRTWQQNGTLYDTAESSSAVTATIGYTAGAFTVGRNESSQRVAFDASGLLVHDAELSTGQLSSHRAGGFPVSASAGAWLLGVDDPDPDSAQSNDLTLSTESESVALAAGPDDTTGPAVSAVSADPDSTTAVVTWTTDEPATSEVEYGTTGSYGDTESSAVLSTSHAVTVTGLTAGTGYHFRVTSADSNGNETSSVDAEFTTDALATPSAPTGLAATPGDGQVSLTWSTVADADTYTVLRSTTSGSGFSTLTSGLTSPSHVDTTATNDTTYYYVVRAVNVSGSSGDSTEASATPTEPAASGTWQDMWDGLALSPGNEAADMADITAWFVDNCGHLNAPDGTIALISTGTIEVDDAWLAANEDGTHVYEDGDRWVVDGFEITGRLETKTSDVTFRRILIDMSGHDTWGMGHDPFYDAPYRNLEFEWITIDGGDESTGDAFSFYTDSDITDNLQFRYMDIYGMKSGLRLYGGEDITFSYVHDPFFEPGLHSAAASIRGNKVYVGQSLLIGANSGALAVYADGPSGLDDILVEENVLSRISDVGTGYCTNHNKDGPGEGGPSSTNCRLIDNIYATRCNSSVGEYWNTITGNQTISGGSQG